MINQYAAQKYTARRQAEERGSARAWNLVRGLQRQPQDRVGASVANSVGTRQQLVESGDGCPSPRRSWPTIQ
ncbi:MAG: hypothetical protein WA751_10140 [Candidatus Dormiibacterota bacterium]